MLRCRLPSLALVLSLGACGDSNPNTTPSADAGVAANDIVSPPGDIVAPPSDVPAVDDAALDAGSGAALDYSTVRTGRSCTASSDCANGQTCEPGLTGRLCTARCTQGTRSAEEGQCGGRGSTCLIFGNNGTSRSDYCVRGCVASATSERLGACGEGFVCTTNWNRQVPGMPESTPGCFPLCTSDAQCVGVISGDAGAPYCNPRVGICRPFAPSMSLRPDGAPCDPMMQSAPQCRGLCFGLNAAFTQGICGSYINLATTQRCLDHDLETMPPITQARDNLGLCLFKRCTTNLQCDDGLRCVYPEDAAGTIVLGQPSLCRYATRTQPNGIPVSDDAGAPIDAR